jgi:hypothetical protein
LLHQYPKHLQGNEQAGLEGCDLESALGWLSNSLMEAFVLLKVQIMMLIHAYFLPMASYAGIFSPLPILNSLFHIKNVSYN